MRDGFARYDAGVMDAFELDELINRYKRATQNPYSFCVGAGGQVEHVARVLEWQAAEGERTDW